MSIKLTILQLTFLVAAFSLCADPSQAEGQCKSCGPLDILINGTCFAKIRGCLRQVNSDDCLECQFGYVLSNKNCIRDAVFNNNTNLTFIPPVVINNGPILSAEDIRNKLGQQFGSYFSDVHDLFLAKYSQLGKGNVKTVDRLETRKGTFLTIEYESDTKVVYDAVAFVNNSGNVKEWSFEAFSSFRKDPFTVNATVSKAFGEAARNYSIYQLVQQQDIFTIDYINSLQEIKRVTVDRKDLNNTNIGLKLKVQTLSLVKLAHEQAIKQFPYYSSFNLTNSTKYQNYYVLFLGTQVSVSGKFDGSKFLFNAPIENVVSPTPTNGTTGGTIIVGGFSNFTNYTDPRFISALELAAKQFPQIIGGSVTKVQSQVVAGTNFLINISKNTTNNLTDLYEFKIWYTLQQVSQMIEGKKNSNFIYTNYYNYNQDANFMANYKIIETTSRIFNMLPIQSVFFKHTANRKYYKIVYSDKQFSEFEYFTDTNKSNFISYTIEGQNIMDVLTGVRPQASKRSSDVLLAAIQAKQPLTVNAKIKQVSDNGSVYTLILITSNGTYRTNVEDKGDLIIKQFTKISNLTCYEPTENQTQNNQKIGTINQFLVANYPLTGFNIQLFQLNVLNSTYLYRFLYTNSKLRQIEIYVEQSGTTANVKKASFINFGFEVIDGLSTSTDYAKILTALNSTSFVGTKVPFFTQGNSTHMRSYYNDGKSTHEITLEKANGKVETKVINTRSVILVPDGFAIENLVYPYPQNTITTTLNQTLTKIIQQANVKYPDAFKNSGLSYADKINNSYNLLFKVNPSTSSGATAYVKITATDATPPVLSQPTPTAFKDSDFSNCRQYSLSPIAGICVSCNQNTEVEYQGVCYTKIEGCLIQAGSICVKCNGNYVKSAGNCYRECALFFK